LRRRWRRGSWRRSLDISAQTTGSSQTDSERVARGRTRRGTSLHRKCARGPVGWCRISVSKTCATRRPPAPCARLETSSRPTACSVTYPRNRRCATRTSTPTIWLPRWSAPPPSSTKNLAHKWRINPGERAKRMKVKDFPRYAQNLGSFCSTIELHPRVLQILRLFDGFSQGWISAPHQQAARFQK